jgi:small-conductance mechanosensitive channel
MKKLLLLMPTVASAQDRPELNIFQHISILTVIEIGVVLLVAWAVVRTVGFALEALSRRVPRARFFFMMLSPIARFAIWIGTAAFVLGAILAPTQQTLWAMVTALGVALGLGAQDLVKNLVGGLVILTDRPYQLGDRVKIGDAYGEIDHIGLRSTKLTTPEDTRVTIPNADILNGMAWNANSGNLDCQVVTDVFLPPDTDPEEAVSIGYESAYCSPLVLLSKPVVVLFQDQFDQQPHVRLRIKAYVYDHRFEPAFQSDISQRAKSQFLKRGMLGNWKRVGV